MRYRNPWCAALGIVLAFCIAASAYPGPTVVAFWHTQSRRNANVLREIIRQFNARQDRWQVVPQYCGSYTQIYQKLVTSIRAGKPPALAVAYQSMVSSYMTARAVTPLDDYFERGMTPAEKADLFPAFLANNRFPNYGNRLLSFPFSKSILTLYYNVGLLEAVGRTKPPATWKEFHQICRDVRRQLKKGGYALSIDASSLDAMVYSFGGELLAPDHQSARFEAEPARRALRVIERMTQDGSAYRVSYRSRDDRNDFAWGRVAFALGSSTGRPYLEREIGMFRSGVRWSTSIIPHGEGCRPVTVLYGANICMFKTTPEIQQGAWEFIKYFCSTEVTANWAMRTGYLPVRRSATELPEVRAYFARPENQGVLRALPFARTEPFIIGWQEVRLVIEEAETAVAIGRKTADQAADELDREADRIIGYFQGARMARTGSGTFWIGVLVVAAFVTGVVLTLRRTQA